MKVSLIATVLNAAADVEGFLGSIAAQTRPPDEIVIADGGSNDGTVELLRSNEHVTVIEEPGANIARGRNLAIAAATHDVIAVADADCRYDPGWLEHLLEPLEAGAEVSMGFYLPVADGFFQECMAAVNLPVSADEVDPDRFMPSARSVAFRREAIESVGHYPEWLDIGEDMWVDVRWRERGVDMRFAPEAVARWPLRPTLRATWRQYFRYAMGDGHAGLHPERHAVRYGVYVGWAATLVTRRRWPKLVILAAGFAYAWTPLRRARRQFEDPRERAAAMVVVPALMAWIDTAKISGYAVGLADRLSGAVWRRLGRPDWSTALSERRRKRRASRRIDPW
jgi:glycosyltransferase involved in cell wall biosynthesis